MELPRKYIRIGAMAFYHRDVSERKRVVMTVKLNHVLYKSISEIYNSYELHLIRSRSSGALMVEV